MNRGVEFLAIKEEFGVAAVDGYRDGDRHPGDGRVAVARGRVAAPHSARPLALKRSLRRLFARLAFTLIFLFIFLGSTYEHFKD